MARGQTIPADVRLTRSNGTQVGRRRGGFSLEEQRPLPADSTASIAALIALLLPTAAPAHAQDPVTLGGGSGLVVNGETLCTLTAIGNDNRGNLIGFTSAHCGGPGAQVAAEGA